MQRRGFIHQVLFLAQDSPVARPAPGVSTTSSLWFRGLTLSEWHISTLYINLYKVRVGRLLSNADTVRGLSVETGVKSLRILEDLRIFIGPRVLGQTNAGGEDVLGGDVLIRCSVSVYHVLVYSSDHTYHSKPC